MFVLLRRNYGILRLFYSVYLRYLSVSGVPIVH